MLMKRKKSSGGWSLKEDALIIVCWNEDINDLDAAKVLEANGFERTSVSIGSRRRRKLYDIEKVEDLAELHEVSAEDAQKALDEATQYINESRKKSESKIKK